MYFIQKCKYIADIYRQWGHTTGENITHFVPYTQHTQLSITCNEDNFTSDGFSGRYVKDSQKILPD